MRPRTVKKIRTTVRVDGPVEAAMCRGRLPAAAEETHDAADAAGEHEARDGGADQHLALMAADVGAPVRGLLDLGAELLERVAELAAVCPRRRAGLPGAAR